MTEVTLTGAFTAQIIEHVDAPVSGTLETWFVEPGQEVYEDQLLARIRNADLDAAVQKAQSQLEAAEARIAELESKAIGIRLEVSRAAADQIRARSELDRVEKTYLRQKMLMDAGATPRLAFEKAESDFKAASQEMSARNAAAKDAQAQADALAKESELSKQAVADRTADLQKSKQAVSDAELHSPDDGVLLSRRIQAGEKMETPEKDIAIVAGELTKLEATLRPDASTLARIHAGQHAFVRLPSVSDAEFPGEVAEIRGLEVIVRFTSTSPITKLNTAAQVRIVF